MTAAGGVKMVVGVEEFDAVDGSVGGEVDVQFVGDADGLDGLGFLAQLDIGDVVLRVVGDAHGLFPFQYGSIVALFINRSSHPCQSTTPKVPRGCGGNHFPRVSLPHAAVVFAAGVGFFGSAGDVGPVVDFDG